MESQTASQEHRLHKRHDCVGLTYYTAWMKNNGNPPVCVGFSQVKDTGLAQTVDSVSQPPELRDAEAPKDFKLICLGYSSCSSTDSAMPHCEGIELVLEVPSQARAHAAEGQAEPARNDSTATEDQPPHARLMSKAAQNWGLLQAACRNEGLVVFKPWPKDQDELQARVTETLQRNGSRMYSGAVRIGQNAYASTVQPLAAILGVKPRPKS